MCIIDGRVNVIVVWSMCIIEEHDAELAFPEIRHSYSTFPLKTAVPN